MSRKIDGRSLRFPSLKERFAAAWEACPVSGCHLWTAARSASGYGAIWSNGKGRAAHRVAWELKNGPVPDGLFVLHRCDVRECVNTDHLYIGTARENIADMDRRGRRVTPRGSELPHAKLTEGAIRSIRKRLAAGEVQTAIAADYGVRDSAISRINTRKHWEHVT